MTEAAQTTDNAKKPKSPSATYIKVLKGYPNLVAQLATMQPILKFDHVEWGLGRVAGRSKRVKNKAIRRLKRLVDLDYAPLSKKVIAMKVCPPPYALTVPVRRPCRVGHFCPYCWARRAVEAWKVVDDAFFLDPRTRPPEDLVASSPSPSPQFRGRGVQLRSGPAHSKPTRERLVRNPLFDLIERYGIWEVPHLIDINQPGLPYAQVSGVRHWLDRRANGLSADPWQRKSDIKNAVGAAAGRPWGAMEVVKIVPSENPDLEGGWKILAYQILLVPAGVPVPATAHGMRRTVSPSRHQVAQAVARAFRYPTFMLKQSTPNELVIAALELRRGSRMMETFGLFRGRRKPE